MSSAMRSLYLTGLVCLLLISVRCSEDAEVNEADTFLKIYDNNIFSYSFSPIDVIQTADGGYVVVAERFLPDVAMPGVHLLKADEFGNFVRDIPLPEELTNPLTGIASREGKLYFICMNTSSQGQLVSLDESLDNVVVSPLSINYPAAASFSDNEFLVLSYDQIEKKSILSRVSTSASILASRSFTIAYDDSMEDEVIKHFLRTGKRYPFQTGRLSSGLYYFNGFYDYTFSLVFTSLGDDEDVDGVVQGQQDHGGFSSVVPIGGTNFATAIFNYDDNYVLPSVTLSTSAPTSIADLDGFDMREIVPNSAVQILRTTLAGQNVLVYATSTRSKQIGLFVYDEATGEFLGSRYFGFTNPFEFGKLSVTDDEGAIVTGVTYVAGRFSRPVLIKLSKQEFASIARR